MFLWVVRKNMTLSTIKITNRDHEIAKLSAIAVALSLVEFFFPSPIPGVKPGIANIIILYTIWKTLNKRGCIESYLLIMYSYYKLEDFNFPTTKFKSGLDCISIIQDTNTISIIDSLIKF